MYVDFDLPNAVNEFHSAFKKMQSEMDCQTLKFTLDGRLLGDIAEALVAKHFGLTLCERRVRGVDAYSGNKSVQIKATQFSDKGPRFTPGMGVADHLIFVWLDFPNSKMRVVYNGPEAPVRNLLPKPMMTTTTVSRRCIEALNNETHATARINCYHAQL